MAKRAKLPDPVDTTLHTDAITKNVAHSVVVTHRTVVWFVTQGLAGQYQGFGATIEEAKENVVSRMSERIINLLGREETLTRTEANELGLLRYTLGKPGIES